MVSGKTWSFTWPNRSKEFSFRINLSETYDIVTNKSLVTITSMQVKATAAQSESSYPNGQVLINGEPVIVMNSRLGTHNVKARHAGTWYDIRLSGGEVATGSIEIEHEYDGSKEVLLELVGLNSEHFSFPTISGEGSWVLSSPETQTLTLTTIPRASTIGATDADIGSKSSVIVTQKSTVYTHSIKFLFGNISGYINADGSVSATEVKLSVTSIAFTVPISFYAEIPDGTYGICTLVCTTYSADTQIGDKQTTTFKATANRNTNAPAVAGTVIDSNEVTLALTGDSSKLVRYYSNALCTIEATAKNNATIESKKIGGNIVAENTLILQGVESRSVEFSATDSRGYTTSIVVDAQELIEYIKLTANVQLSRKDPTSGNAVLSVSGDYFAGSFGATSNSISAMFRIARAGGSFGEYQNIDLVVDGNAYTGTVDLAGLDYEYSYTAQVLVYDKLIHLDKTAPVAQGIPVFDWGQKDFRFNVPICMPATMYGEDLPSNAKKGQLFFQKNTDGTYSIRIYSGSSWS